jgi:hypothetical protein
MPKQINTSKGGFYLKGDGVAFLSNRATSSKAISSKPLRKKLKVTKSCQFVFHSYSAIQHGGKWFLIENILGKIVLAQEHKGFTQNFITFPAVFACQ